MNDEGSVEQEKRTQIWESQFDSEGHCKDTCVEGSVELKVETWTLNNDKIRSWEACEMWIWHCVTLK